MHKRKEGGKGKKAKTQGRKEGRKDDERRKETDL